MPIDLLGRKAPPPDHRIAYGPDPSQFGELRLPQLQAGQRAPVLVFLHGGWWRAAYGLEYAGHLCAALKQDGVATWSLEYRRVGNPGGGYPGTFLDVAAGFDSLRRLARDYPLDLDRVAAAGHSAGGQLAFWLAGRTHIPPGSPLSRPVTSPAPPGLKAVVALAGAVDLRLLIDLSGWFTYAHDKREVVDFMGATPAEAPDRYRAGDPGELLPLNVPQYLLQGSEDDQVPLALAVRWVERARRIGEQATLEQLAGADHFDVVDPASRAWPHVRLALLRALGLFPAGG